MALTLEARDVPLGGLRAMNVRRTLPHRGLPTIGAWCFLDRFGPQLATMRVEPHPHTGLQTVTWPLAGEIRHRDTLGSDVVLRPGELNLMTAGAGIAHSEYSMGDSPALLDALQLWVALPDHARHREPTFETHRELPTVELGGRGGAGTATVILGTFAGVTSPATAYTPIVGAQIWVPARTTLTLPLEPSWEHGVLVADGTATVADASGPLDMPDHGGVLYLGAGRESVEVESASGATLVLLGGEPFAEQLVMWWNFVGRDHAEIVTAWHDWNGRSARFGEVPGHGGVRIPAPPMPEVRLAPRSRRI